MRKVSEATYTATPRLPDTVVVVERAAGSTITLPAANGSGFRYTFVVGTTITSNSLILQAASADDVMAGVIVGAADTDSSVNAWEAAATSDTITLNGTTTGGIKGDTITLIDIAEGQWAVSGIIQQTGIEATPFSAAV